MQVAGKIIHLLPVQTGTGRNGEWIKQEFILETQEQYPKKICISTFGLLATSMDSYSQDDEIIAYYNLESREYNERWYTEVRAFKIEKPKAKSSSDETTQVVEEKQQESINTSVEADDLPF